MTRKMMILLAAAVLAATACKEEVPLTKDSRQTVYVTADAGFHSFGVSAQGDWSVVMDEDAKRWCEFSGPSYGSGYGAFSVRYDANLFDGVRRGLRRQAMFTVITEDRFTSVTILFRQSGLAPHLEFSQDTYEIAGDSMEGVLAIGSNLSVYEAGQISCSVDGNWIDGVRLNRSGSELTVNCSANPSTQSSRTAEVEITFTDCWGEVFKDTARIIQSARQPAPEVNE